MAEALVIPFSANILY